MTHEKDPKEALTGYFDRWIELQRASLEDINAAFSGVALLHLMLRKGELCGLESLYEAAQELYEYINPEEVLAAHTETIKVNESGETCELALALPFFDKRDLGLLRDGEYLVVSLANQTRRIPLPEQLRGRDVRGARYENGTLVVSFDGAVNAREAQQS